MSIHPKPPPKLDAEVKALAKTAAKKEIEALPRVEAQVLPGDDDPSGGKTENDTERHLESKKKEKKTVFPEDVKRKLAGRTGHISDELWEHIQLRNKENSNRPPPLKPPGHGVNRAAFKSHPNDDADVLYLGFNTTTELPLKLKQEYRGAAKYQKVKVLLNPSLEKIEAMIATGRFKTVIIGGHGTTGYALLADKDGTGQLLDTNALADILAKNSAVKSVIGSFCYSAHGGDDAFTTQLAKRGIASVGFNNAVNDAYAILATKELIRLIAKGHSLKEAHRITVATYKHYEDYRAKYAENQKTAELEEGDERAMYRKHDLNKTPSDILVYQEPSKPVDSEPSESPEVVKATPAESPEGAAASDLKVAADSALAARQTQQRIQEFDKQLKTQVADFRVSLKTLATLQQQLKQPGPRATAEETQAIKDRVEELRSNLKDKLESIQETHRARVVATNQVDQEKATQKNALNSARKNTNTETSYGDFISIGATTGDISLSKEELKDVELLGVKVEGAYKLLTAEAGANLKIGVTQDGLTVNAQAVAKAALVDFAYEFKVETPDITLKPSDEIIGAKLFVMVKGMVGAEAKAALMANAQRKPLEQNGAGGLPKLNPQKLLAGTGMKAPTAKGVAVGAAGSAEAFAGAKLSVGVGGAVEWKKKHPSVYTQKLSAAIAQLFPTVGTLAKGSPELTVQFLDFLFGKGTPGTVTVLGIEATGEGSAGIGGKLAGKLAFEAGKLTVQMGANGTFGLGLGGNVQVTLNMVDGAKLILLWGTDLLKLVTPAIRKKGENWIASYAPAVQEVAKWWTSDVEALQSIKTKGLAKTELPDRIKLARVLLDGIVTEEEEWAVLQILEFSYGRGELKRLADAVGHGWILAALDGDRNTRAKKLGVSWW